MNDAAKLTDRIIEVARDVNIQIVHPIVVCVVAIIYGNDKCRKLFKLTKDGATDDIAYNVVTDLLAVSRLAMIRTITAYNGNMTPIQFMTFDKNQEYIAECFNQKKARVYPSFGSNRQTEYSFQLDSGLFTGIATDGDALKKLEEKLMAAEKNRERASINFLVR